MYKEKMEKILAELSTGLFEREECLKLVLLSMFAGKSIFLYGPPGTAKSMIARRASLAFDTLGNSRISTENSRIPNENSTENSRIPSENSRIPNKNKGFFAYLMNRFSTPEEIFGPIDIAELKKNNLTRKTDGYLPTAHFAFLDEIWKSSPAILNTLLTIINERIYRDGNTDVKVPLKGIVCASNEFPPANQGLEALYDRMILRYFVKPLEERESFDKLLFEDSPICEKVSNAFELSELENIQAKSKKITFSPEAKELIHAIKGAISLSRTSTQSTSQSSEQTSNQAKQNSQAVGANQAPYISDRRWKQCAELLQIAALLSDREQVTIQDVVLLRHALWENENQVELVKNIIANNILMLNKENEIVAAIKDDYKKLSQIIDKAPKLEHKEIATELGQRTTNAIETIKDEYLKEKISANPFLSDNDMELAFSHYIANIVDLQNIALGAKELEEKISSCERTQKAEALNQTVNAKKIQELREEFKRKIKLYASDGSMISFAIDILDGKRELSSLEPLMIGTFIFTPWIRQDVSHNIEHIKALINEYKAKIDELK